MTMKCIRAGGQGRNFAALARGLALVAFLCSAPEAGAVTYFVDPSGGSNANNGTSPSTPWMNPPGTMASGGGAFYGNARWGAITGSTSTSNAGRIQCGDVILLRPGRTFTSANSGSWCFASSSSQTSNCSGAPWFYSTGCESNPITIKIATPTDWSGVPTTGHVDFDGTGVTPIGAPDYNAIVNFSRVNGLHILGVDANRRLRVRNSSGCGFLFLNTFNGGPPNTNTVLDWFEAQNTDSGICFGGHDNYRISNGIIHDSRYHGIDIGFKVDWQSGTGVFRDLELFNNGLQDTVGFSSDGIVAQATGRAWFDRVKIHDERANCINGGSARQVGQGIPQVDTFRAIFRDARFYRCGSAGFGGRSGVAWDGDGDLTVPHTYLFIQGLVSYGHPGNGIWANHGTGRMNVWQATTFGNGRAQSSWGEIWWERTADIFEIHNSIVGPGRSYSQSGSAWTVNAANGLFDQKPLSNFNLYDFLNSPSDTLSYFRWTQAWPSTGGSYSQSLTSYANIAQLGFSGGNDLVSTSARRYQPRFASIGGNCDNPSSLDYASCDFRPCTGAGAPVSGCTAASDAIDRGTFFLRANGGGSGNTINVRRGDPLSAKNGTDANGVLEYGDPRNFFMSPATFPGSTGDPIQIEGCGQRTVTALTATSITFSGAPCTWADNAGVHRPWAGAGPDIGAFETGGTGGGGSTAPSPPTLLSVEPI
jgi:hypothetical protein